MPAKRLAESMNSLLCVMALSGLYVPVSGLQGTKKERLIFVLCAAAALLSITLPWIGAYRIARTLSADNLLSGMAMTQFGNLLQSVLVFHLSLLHGLDVARHFKTWLERVEAYQNRYRTAESGETARLSRVISIVSCVSTLVVFFIFVGTMVVARDFLCTIWEYGHHEAEDGDACILNVCFTVAQSYYDFMRLPSALLFFLIISVLVVREARRLNAALLQENLEKLESVPQQLEHYRLRHLSLCSLISDANRCVRHFLFAVYVFGTPSIVFFMRGYAGMKTAGELDEITDYWSLSYFLLIIVLIAVVTCVGAWITRLMRQPQVRLFHLNMQKMKAKGPETISMFLCQLQGSSLGFHVMHLFTIETSTILMICGTIMTYALIIIQFQPVVTGGNTAPANSSFVTLPSV